MKPIRVLIVEDSLTVRRRLVETLAADPAFQVVGEAADGRAAIELCQRLRPDVITLDMMLPNVTGVAATEHIMAHFPTPILIVSASVNRGELYRTYDALTAGAVDVLEKPNGTEPEGEWEKRFVERVKLVSRIKVIRHLKGKFTGSPPPTDSAPAPFPLPPLANDALTRHGSSPPARAVRLIALGASTGGPGALLDVLRAIPESNRVPILVVLHLAESFATAFADWLDSQTPHRVRYARSGESFASLGSGVVMAPPNLHLEVKGGRLLLSDAPSRHSCRPSVDVLFESLAQEFGADCVAALLTGMGRDGATGLLQIRQAGGHTIAQDEQSCVVYGMPREAALLGAAQRVLSLREIGAALAQLSLMASRGQR